VNYLQIDTSFARIANLFRSWAGLKGKTRAINNSMDATMPIASIATIGHLKLERQSPAVHKAHVNPIDTILSEARFKFRVHRRSATNGAVAGLLWATALTQLTHVTLSVAACLWPVASACDVFCVERVRLTRLQHHILPVWTNIG
jgi:hypothetical protein